MKQMYKAIAHSPTAKLTGAILSTDTTIKVDSVEGFLEAPNLAVISSGNNFETIRYGAIGELTLEQCERGIEGTAQGFFQGAKIARYYTAIEHNAIVENIEELYDTKTSEGGLDLTGVLPIENGGTSADTAEGARIALSLIGYTGETRTQFGQQATASDSNSVALGYNASANNISTIAIGQDAAASGNNSIVLGSNTIASGSNSIALGTDVLANGYQCIAMGKNTMANYNAGIALGSNSIATGANSVAIGRDTIASMYQTVAMGLNSIASGGNSVAIGYGTRSENTGSISIGTCSQTVSLGSIAIGGSSYAEGTSVAIGLWAKASNNSTALGFWTVANGFCSAALGFGADATGSRSVAVGDSLTASGTNSSGLGCLANATGSHSVALGYLSAARGDNSVALGQNATVLETSPDTIQLGDATNLSILSCKVALTVTSDERDKIDIEPVVNSLEFLSKIETVTYKFNHRSDYALDIEKDIKSLEEKQQEYEKAQKKIEELEIMPETIKSEETGETIPNPDYDASTISTYQLVSPLTEEEQLELEEKKARREKRNLYGLADYDKEEHTKGTKKRNRQRIGVLAQQVQSAMIAEYGTDDYADILINSMYGKDESEIPEGVENILGVNYSCFTPLLIDGVKRLHARDQFLEERVQTLEGQNEFLVNQNKLLEERLQALESKIN